MTINELIERISTRTRYNCLYHFTDEANLESIYERGLLSKQKMLEKNFSPERTGGNQLSHNLDFRDGIDHYVSLCFTNRHSMMHTAYKKGRLLNPYYLEISPQVLKIPGVRIAFGIANANETTILLINGAIKAIKKLDTDIIKYLYRNTEYEVLIPNKVPKDLIK